MLAAVAAITPFLIGGHTRDPDLALQPNYFDLLQNTAVTESGSEWPGMAYRVNPFSKLYKNESAYVAAR